MFQKYVYFAFICRFFALKHLFGIRYSKRLKTLKIGLKNAFSELAPAQAVRPTREILHYLVKIR